MVDLLEKPAFLILLLVILLLFGAKRLPDLARGLGRSARILKSETEGLRTDEPAAAAAPPAVTQAPAAPQVAAPAEPRYLVDPVTGEKVLAQPVTPPADGAPRA